MSTSKPKSGDESGLFVARYRRKNKKNTSFEKRTGEVIENKESAPESEPDRTGQRSGEVVENTYVRKKRTENEPKNQSADVIENKR